MIRIEDNIAHIDSNGYTATVMYEPNTTPLLPFLTLGALTAFAESIEAEFNSLDPKSTEEIAGL